MLITSCNAQKLFTKNYNVKNDDYSFDEYYKEWKDMIEITATNDAVNIFLTRNTALDYILSSIITLTQNEIRKKNNIECSPNKNSNIIMIEEKIWDYTIKDNPVSSLTFPYKFQSLYKNFNDLWDNKNSWNTELGYLGIFTNTNDVPNVDISSPFMEYSLDIAQVTNIDNYLNSFGSLDDKKVEYNLFIDDLLLSNLWPRKKEKGLFGLLNRTKHIYILPEGATQSSQSTGLPSDYANWKMGYYNKNNPYDPNIALVEEVDLYNKTFKDGYWDFTSNDFNVKFEAFKNALYTDNQYILYNYLENNALFDVYFYNGSYAKAIEYKSKSGYDCEEARLVVNNALIDYGIYASLFDLKNPSILYSSFEGIFSIDSEQPYDFLSFIDYGSEFFDSNKTNLIFTLDKVWSLENISQPAAKNSVEDIELVITQMQSMMKKYSEFFPVSKYNYIFKAHPRVSKQDHIETTKLFCEKTNIRPVILTKDLPFEIILGKDLLENKTSGDYNLINPSDFLVEKPFSQLTGFFCGYQITSTLFFTTIQTINAYNNKNCTQIMLKTLIPPKFNLIPDSFRVNGNLGKLCEGDPLDSNRTYIILTCNYFWKVNEYTHINEWIVLKDFIAIDVNVSNNKDIVIAIGVSSLLFWTTSVAVFVINSKKNFKIKKIRI